MPTPHDENYLLNTSFPSGKPGGILASDLQDYVVSVDLLPVWGGKQSANFAAAVGTYYTVDTTSGNITATLPTAPIDGSFIAVKMTIQGGTNTVTIQAGGSDVFNKTSGSTTETLSLLNQGIVFRYAAAAGFWVVLADDIALAQLDARYVQSTSSSLLPSQSGLGGQILTTNGSTPAWENQIVADGSTLTLSGNVMSLANTWAGDTQITQLGTVTQGTWSATPIAIAEGGTGQTTAPNAINALLPSQTGQSGNVLTTNGTAASWGSAGGPAPTAATGSAAGSGGSLGVTITGSDASMQVALTTGNTETGAGTLFTVSFGTAFAAAPNPVFSPTTAATAALTVSKQFYITASTSGITFSCGVGLSTTSTYTWNIKL